MKRVSLKASFSAAYLPQRVLCRPCQTDVAAGHAGEALIEIGKFQKNPFICYVTGSSSKVGLTSSAPLETPRGELNERVHHSQPH